MLVKSVRTVSREFYWEKKRVYIGLTSLGNLRVLRQYFAAVQNFSSCCLTSVCGVEQGFSNYGSRPQMGPRNVISGFQNQLAWQIRCNNFCKISKKIESRPAVNLFLMNFYFRGNILLYAVSCLLWFLPELANNNKNQAQHVMRCYTMIVSTYWPILTSLHSFRYEGMILFRL